MFFVLDDDVDVDIEEEFDPTERRWTGLCSGCMDVYGPCVCCWLNDVDVDVKVEVEGTLFIVS